MYFTLFLFCENGGQKPFLWKNYMASLAQDVALASQRKEAVEWGPLEFESLGRSQWLPTPLLYSLSSGDPLAHRSHIRVILIMWQPPDVIFVIVIIWLLPVPGFTYLFSFLLERRPQGHWCGLTSGPSPYPPHPRPVSGQNNSFPLNIHLPGLRGPGPDVPGQVAQHNPIRGIA